MPVEAQSLSPPSQAAVKSNNAGVAAYDKGERARAVELFRRACDGNRPAGCEYLGTLRRDSENTSSSS